MTKHDKLDRIKICNYTCQYFIIEFIEFNITNIRLFVNTY